MQKAWNLTDIFVIIKELFLTLLQLYVNIKIWKIKKRTE